METQFHIITNKLRKQYEVKQNPVQVNAVKSQPVSPSKGDIWIRSFKDYNISVVTP